jgi:phosphoadenosine phosphosulfate reductase
VKYDLHYSVTTIDFPEVVRFIKENYKHAIFERPQRPLLELLAVKGFPMRQSRWCCELYKENGGAGRHVITGIRWQESSRRAKRQMVETCYKDGGKKYLHPIIDWTEKEIWEFIKKYRLKYPSLYDKGFKRLGCMFCPMSSNREREARLYPRFAKLFVKYFQKLYDLRKSQNNKSVDRWSNGQEMFNWWISSRPEKEQPENVLFE